MKKSLCASGKIRHESEEDARMSAREGMLRDAPALYTYWCLLCTGWHLTSRVPSKSMVKHRK